MSVQIVWQDRRGAGHVEIASSSSTVLSRLKRLRCEAKVLAPDYDEPIGGVDDRAGYTDDGRLRWVWWLDEEACDAAC
jgi:hypothetical protein